MLFDKQANLECVTALTLRLSLRICGMAIQILATVWLPGLSCTGADIHISTAAKDDTVLHLILNT